MKGQRTSQQRGKTFEQEIIATNQKYMAERKGVISKIPTGVRAIPSARGVKWIPAEKTGCDFIGHYKGVPVAIEAKSTSRKTSFQLFTHDKPMVGDHQLDFLKRFEQSGGRSYVFIKFTPLRRYFIVPVSKYMEMIKNAVEANKKSIPLIELEMLETTITDYLEERK